MFGRTNLAHSRRRVDCDPDVWVVISGKSFAPRRRAEGQRRRGNDDQKGKEKKESRDAQFEELFEECFGRDFGHHQERGKKVVCKGCVCLKDAWVRS